MTLLKSSLVLCHFTENGDRLVGPDGGPDRPGGRRRPESGLPEGSEGEALSQAEEVSGTQRLLHWKDSERGDQVELKRRFLYFSLQRMEVKLIKVRHPKSGTAKKFYSQA